MKRNKYSSKDVKMDSVILGQNASVKSVLIWYSRGITFTNYEYWLSNHMNVYDKVKHVKSLDECIETIIGELTTAYENSRDLIEQKSEVDVNIDDIFDNVEILDKFLEKSSNRDTYREMLVNLLTFWNQLQDFDVFSEISSQIDFTFNKYYE